MASGRPPAAAIGGGRSQRRPAASPWLQDWPDDPATVVELSSAMAEWIDGFYNPLRRHSSLDYLTPNEYEALHSKQAQAAFS
jgi:transposase InsO family protein